MALNTSPLFNASLWVCGAMKQVMLRLFVPLSPQPLFCSIAPQTPAPIPCSCPGFPPRGNEHIDPRSRQSPPDMSRLPLLDSSLTVIPRICK